MKRRAKELGLYSILGLEKKHIGVMSLYQKPYGTYGQNLHLLYISGEKQTHPL